MMCYQKNFKTLLRTPGQNVTLDMYVTDNYLRGNQEDEIFSSFAIECKLLSECLLFLFGFFFVCTVFCHYFCHWLTGLKAPTN